MQRLRSGIRYAVFFIGFAVAAVTVAANATGVSVRDALKVLGLTIPDAVVVLGGMTVAAAAMIWENASLHAQLTSHANSPNLLWQGVTVKALGQGFELTVACKNDGPTARLDRASDVTGTYSYFGSSETAPFAIDLKLDTGGYIETGVFSLVMECDNAVNGADHVVTWRIVYWDPQLRLAYLSTCSATVRLAVGVRSLVGTPNLDPTSPAERHAAYKRNYQKGTPGNSRRVAQ